MMLLAALIPRSSYCDRAFVKILVWQLTNKKTEIIVFRNGGPLRSYEHWVFKINPVNVTSVYKYMGLLFTSKLSWRKAKEKLAAQARKSIFAIISYQRNFGYFSYTEYFKLFDSMVKPILRLWDIWNRILRHSRKSTNRVL